MAVVGVGIDVVDVERFGESLERTPGLRERLFTPGENGHRLASLLGHDVDQPRNLAKSVTVE